MRPGNHAFTLLEFAMALAAMAIVAVFALPSWSGQIARSHRIEVVTALYRAAQFVDTQVAVPAMLPAGMDQSPPTGPPVYRLRLLAVDESNGGYELEATPVAMGPMHGDPCGIFTLDATGVRGNRAAMADTAAPVAQECWRGR